MEDDGDVIIETIEEKKDMIMVNSDEEYIKPMSTIKQPLDQSIHIDADDVSGSINIHSKDSGRNTLSGSNQSRIVKSEARNTLKNYQPGFNQFPDIRNSRP